MQQLLTVPFVGGSRHGQTIQVDNNTYEIEIDVHTAGPPTDRSTLTENYQRRLFHGEDFGDGFDCFVLKIDDEVEQRELARWSLAEKATAVAANVLV